MFTIENANGSTYYVMCEMHNRFGNDNVLLLANYGNKAEDEIQAGASPIQYIVARGWSEKYKCWVSGNYFMIWNHDHKAALNAAKECFEDNVSRILYSVF